jgi:uncharacterized membrane protein YfcA
MRRVGGYALLKRIDYRSGLMFSAATIPGAILGALNTSYVPRRLFDLIFAVLLLAAAAFLGWQPNQKEINQKSFRRITFMPFVWPSYAASTI